MERAEVRQRRTSGVMAEENDSRSRSRTRKPATGVNISPVAVQAAMDRLRLSQAELSRRLGVGKQTVNNWFTTGARPSGEIFSQLLDVLDVSADYLMGRTDSRPVPDSLTNRDGGGQTQSQGSSTEPPTHPSPAQGSGHEPGGEAMGVMDPADPAAWMRMAADALAEIRLQREQVFAPMARAQENMSKAQVDLAHTARAAADEARSQDPRSVAGTAAERREGEAGDSDESSADTQRPATGGGRAAG